MCAGDLAGTGPEEVILRAAVDGSDRDAPVRRLSQLEHAFRVHAPDPADGAIPGSWDRVKQAYFAGLQRKKGYLTVARAVVIAQEEDQ